MDAKDIVLKTLSDAKTPMKCGEIAESSGIDKTEIEKSLKVLKSEDKVFSPKRCFYDIKK